MHAHAIATVAIVHQFVKLFSPKHLSNQFRQTLSLPNIPTIRYPTYRTLGAYSDLIMLPITCLMDDKANYVHITNSLQTVCFRG